ncbi:zinc finger BED domain-containing protein RICESLEEPER 3-like [Quercus suber]|uniref:zinc finger BED domain-containing protein RICESLEEPER 3-like n=1 Tax=Quercus suber TaxID=58331 RepID=UPI0032DE8A96
MSTTSSASTPAPRPPTSTTSESQSLFGEEVESIPVENPQQQGTKRRTTSDIWNHFKKKNIDGKVKAQCNYCGRLMAGASTSGTTHLKLHITKSCPSAPKEALPGEGTNIRKQFLVKQHNRARSKGISSPSVFNEEDRKASRRDLARMVILHEYPLAIVDHVGFRDFVGGLRFICMPSPHDKYSLSKILLECLSDWNIDLKLSAIIVDNASNNDGMMKLVSDKLQASSLILGGKLLHMRCAAHILNLVVQEGLNVIGDGIEKVRSSVYFWTQSPKRTEIFEKISRQSHIASTKELVLDCRTRWNSTYLMLSTALIYKDVFPSLLCCEPQYQFAQTNRDWEVAQIVCEKLGYFHKVTELLSGTAYPTANHYFPSVFRLKLELNQWLSSEDELVKKMVAKIAAPEHDDTMRDYDLFVSNATTNIGQRSRDIISEFELYTSEKVAPRTKQFDVLGWWKRNASPALLEFMMGMQCYMLIFTTMEIEPDATKKVDDSDSSSDSDSEEEKDSMKSRSSDEESEEDTNESDEESEEEPSKTPKKNIAPQDSNQ